MKGSERERERKNEQEEERYQVDPSLIFSVFYTALDGLDLISSENCGIIHGMLNQDI